MAGNNIADENILRVDFRNGLWFSDSADQVPPGPGFCQVLENLYVDNAGDLRARPGVVTTSAFLTSKSAPTFPGIPAVATGTFSTNVSARHMINDVFDASANRIYVIPHIGSGASRGYGTISGLSNLTGFVEANNAIYVCGATGTDGVRKITGVTYGPVVISSSAVSGSPLLQGMLYFRGRLFGFRDSTIYFTEVVSAAAPNPETWNTSTNNIILGSEGTRPNIQQIISYNDRLFVFTDSGIFVVVVQGSPAGWIVKPFDLSIRVRTKDCAVQYKGMVYIAADDGVYVFSGLGQPRLISEPIQFWFRFTKNFIRPRVYLAEQFLILSYTTLYPDGTTKVVGTYGMDLTNPGPWFTINMYGGTGNLAVVGSVREVPYSTNSIYDHLIVASFTSAYGLQDNTLCAWIPESTTDRIDGSNTSFICIVETAPQTISHPIKLNHSKYAYIEWVSAPTSFAYIQRVVGGTEVGGTVSSITSGTDLVKIKGTDTPVRQVRTYISWTISNGLYARLEAIYHVLGTERNMPNELSF